MALAHRRGRPLVEVLAMTEAEAVLWEAFDRLVEEGVDRGP